MDYLMEAPQHLPIIGNYDVVVVGGGPAGISAAVSSARLGAKTALIERYGCLGGQATGGLVILLVGLTNTLTNKSERIIKGFCDDTINRLKHINAAKDIGNHVLFDPEAMKYVFDRNIVEHSIKPYYHTFVSSAVITDNKLSAVIIDGKSGRAVIKAKVFVDATGDADLAKFAGVAFEIEQKDNLLPVTLGFRVGGLDSEKAFNSIVNQNYIYMQILKDLGINSKIGGWMPTIHDGEAWFNIAHVNNVSPVCSEDLTHSEIKARVLINKIVEDFKLKLDGFQNVYLIDTAQQIGVRDSRRIIGLHKYKQEDILEEFDTSIAKVPDYQLRGKGFAQVPIECLISKGIDNVIFTGRCISVEHNLIDMFREIPACMATGQAGGVVAALSSIDNDFHSVNVKETNVKQVQNELLNQGAIF